MPLLFEDKVKENKDAFMAKVRDISKNLFINPNWLMFVMNFESGMNHRIQNKFTNATGLIQFMPATAKELGTTVDALKAMTNIKQLDYVYQYLKKYANKFRNFVDVYLTVFFPVAFGKPLDYVIQTKTIRKEIIAKQNPIFDINKDKTITVGEIRDTLLKRVPAIFLNEVKQKALTDVKETIKAHKTGIGIGSVLFFSALGTFAIVKRKEIKATLQKWF